MASGVEKNPESLFNGCTYYFTCRKGEAIRHCVEKSLLKCNDPTPSNVVNSMLGAMKKVK